MKLKKESIYFMIIGLVFVSLVLTLIPFSNHVHEDSHDHHMGDIDGMISMNHGIKSDLINQGKYKCCLKEPCSHCLMEHRECDCLEDIVNGIHPCGECIGEILEGHGNTYLSKYFARALAEKIGENHTDELREIIFEKYGTPVSEQL